MDDRRRVYYNDDRPNNAGVRYLAGGFNTYVCIALTVLLGMQLYTYLLENPFNTLDGDFSDAKYVVMHLTKGLTEVTTLFPVLLQNNYAKYERAIQFQTVNNKHEKLQTEIERISASLPAVVAAAGRARDALELRRNIRQGIDVLDYDRQIVDYALESAGARVLDTGDTVDHMIHHSFAGWSLQVLTTWVCQECNGARAMLRPGSLPGECWSFKGSRGEATIRLLGSVKITGFSLDHIPVHIAPTREISSAPRVFTVEGLESKLEPYPHELGTFEYDINGKPIQYFEVQKPSQRGYVMVRLKILSNWGHPVFTCVYRLRVHGDLTPGQLPQVEGPQGDHGPEPRT